MKKLLSVSIMAMLAVSPMMAHADPVSNTYGPAGYTGEAANTPKAGTGVAAPFATEAIDTADQAGVASAAYVKGAYNAAIRAVNTVAADVATAKAVTDGIENTIKTKINAAAGNGLSTNNNGVLSVNTAETVADGGTGYVTSDLLYDQGYQNATQVGNAIDTKLTDYKVKDVANDGGIEKDASGNISLTSAVQASLGKADTALQTDSALNGANLTNDTVAFGKLNGAAYVDSTEAISTSTANDTTLATSKAVKDYVDASNTSAVHAAEFVVQNKLDDGANGYNIDANTLKIRGVNVANEMEVEGMVATAVNEAAAEATSKANAAQAAAEATAAADATLKADAARDDAVDIVEGKLDDGANGYDVDFKSAKIQGTSIATKADVNSAINGSSVSSSGTINLYNAWGATTTTPVTVNTTGTVSKAAYVEP